MVSHGASVVARVTPLQPHIVPDRRSWISFLEDQLPSDWLAGEWDANTGILAPLPDTGRFSVVTCSQSGCLTFLDGQRTCHSCRQSNGNLKDAASGGSKTGHEPPFQRDCVLTRGGIRCRHNQVSQGLCRSHYALFKVSKSQDDVLAWLKFTTSMPRPFMPCAAAGCLISADNPRSDLPLCSNHRHQLAAKRSRGEILDEQSALRWLSDPVDPPFMLRIGRLNPRMQTEVKYVIQAHLDLARGPVQVRTYRDLINKGAQWKSVSLLATIEKAVGSVNANSRSVYRFIREVLVREERRYKGYDPHHEDLIYLNDLNLRTTASVRREMFEKPPLDLSRITQPWLRDGYRNWLLTILPRRGDSLTGYRIAVLASEVLDGQCFDEGKDPRLLGPSHMSAIINAMNRQWPNYGGAKGVFRLWRNILETGHRSSVWDHVPRAFSYNPRLHKPPTHSRTYRGDNDQGRALPVAAVAHLRNNLQGLAPYPNRDMAIAMLAVLIDTGRRPNEVVSLRRGCLQRDRHGDWILVYDNHKAGRLNRRLPIQQETADAITTWLNNVKNGPETESQWLFPSPMPARSDKFASYGLLHAALRRLIRDVPTLEGPIKDLHGVPVDFGFGGIRPHDFRHSYAQRHVDNGTAPDELRDLLDHEDVRTTMGYYQVNDTRKRAAANLLAPLTYDRNGDKIGLSSARRGLASIAVPYGGCTEPSNVKAGGNACPIRFQCSGCTFYRPDPSYLPDIERHLVELKTNAAQARRLNAPPYAIANFDGQVEDFKQIVDRMRTDLALLPETDRQTITEAATILRTSRLLARPGQHLPLTVKDRP